MLFKKRVAPPHIQPNVNMNQLVSGVRNANTKINALKVMNISLQSQLTNITNKLDLMITSFEIAVTGSTNEGKIVLTLTNSSNYFDDNSIKYVNTNDSSVTGTVTSTLTTPTTTPTTYATATLDTYFESNVPYTYTGSYFNFPAGEVDTFSITYTSP
jgi:hypothetical protein